MRGFIGLLTCSVIVGGWASIPVMSGPSIPPTINDVVILVQDFGLQRQNLDEAFEVDDMGQNAMKLLGGTAPFTIVSAENLTTGNSGTITGDVCLDLPFSGANNEETIQITVSNLGGMQTGTFRIKQGGSPVPATNCTSSGQPPAANAGPDQSGLRALESAQPVVARVQLDGSGSDDDNLPFASVTWSEGGTELASFDLQPSIDLAPGPHLIQLSVVDRDQGSSATDNVSIGVVLDRVPSADAGSDLNPIDQDLDGSETFTLDGGQSDDDFQVQTYVWLEDGLQINTDTSLATLTLSRDVSATAYEFTLEVTDDSGQTSEDTVNVTVSAAAVNQAPTARAGGNRTVIDDDQNGSETFVLDGSASDDDLGIVSYVWRDGSGTQVNVDTSSPTVSVTRDVRATPYDFELTVTDASEASDSVTIMVTVQAPTQGNQAPEANAGPDQDLIDEDGDGQETTTLDGSGSTDPDGTIQLYSWSENGTELATGAQPTLSLEVGSHTLTLTVTDDGGASDTDTVVINVGDPGERNLVDLAGLTPNQRAVAATVDNVCGRLAGLQSSTTLTNGEQDLLARCGQIKNPQTTDLGAVRALDAMAGEEISTQQTTSTKYAGIQQGNVAARAKALRGGAAGGGLSFAGLNLGYRGTTLPVGALASEMSEMIAGGATSDVADKPRRLGFFVNGSVQFGDKERTVNEAGFDFDAIGLTTGIDYRLGTNGFVGLALGLNQGEVSFADADGGGMESDGASLTLYGSKYGRRYYVDLTATYGTIDHDSRRRIVYTELDGSGTPNLVDRTALGSTDADQLSGGFAAGWDIDRGGWTLTPTTSLYLVDVDIDPFDETGADGLNLSYEAQSARSITASLGGTVAYAASRRWGVFRPHLRLEAIREFEDQNEVIGVSFVNDPFVSDPTLPSPRITLITDKPDTDYMMIGVGASFTMPRELSAFFDFESVQAYENLNSYRVTFGLRKQFH